ncbi:class I SAM-dependent rRNA methyltransferase [Luteolibacter ambystomatis]|uniref:Class I SAM-dependent rRNA methyltransferase n=1 Tax=Luteolibacter ambystomatis TaxID=2824561 RepID=A0A975J1K3_9BACT|nr:class I SAM-dependent methyltransferase [Luteolibacter ambystomatis]QUE52340.1 class I SAM-dependent rRNA methyltransferase [Luteolibacter ambystomatis]
MRDLLHAALKRRAPLLTPDTDAVRLVDAEGDGFPDVYLETFADRWLVSTAHGGFPRGFERPDKAVYWKRLDQHQKEAPVHMSGPSVDEPFLIRENGAAFEISFQSGYSQGIFLDQRDNRAEVRRRMQPGLRLLNTFAYTGAFSVAAALGGAETTTLDLSQPYLDWAKRNFTHNGLDPAGHHFCKGDTFHWLKRFAKQGRQFDAIVLDPPTFSRDEKGKVFRVETDYGELASLAMACLAPGGWLLCCTNCRKLDDFGFDRQILAASPKRLKLRHSPMPADFIGDPYLKSVWVEG